MKVKQFNHNSSNVLALPFHNPMEKSGDFYLFLVKGAFTPNVKSVLSESLSGNLGGTQF